MTCNHPIDNSYIYIYYQLGDYMLPIPPTKVTRKLTPLIYLNLGGVYPQHRPWHTTWHHGTTRRAPKGLMSAEGSASVVSEVPSGPLWSPTSFRPGEGSERVLVNKLVKVG